MTPPPRPSRTHHWAQTTLRAFSDQRRQHYDTYARLHIPDPRTAHQTVDRALADLERHWLDLLAAPNPAAGAWSILRHHIIQATHPGSPTTRQDDITRLAELGLTDQEISTTTGLDTAVVRTLLTRPHNTAPPATEDPQSFAAFLTRWQEPFLAAAAAHIHDTTAARNCALDALTRAHQHWRQLLTHPTPIAACYQLLRQAIADRGTTPSTPQADPLEAALRRLHSLEPRQADCVRLRHLAALAYADTAQLLGISPAHARTQTWLGLRFLYNDLDTCPTPPESTA